MFGKISNSVELGYAHFKDYVAIDPSILKFSRIMAEEFDVEVFEMILKDHVFKIEFDHVNCLADQIEAIYRANLGMWHKLPNSSGIFRAQMKNLKKIKLLIEHDYIPDFLLNDAFFEKIWLEWDYRMDIRFRKFARVWQDVYYFRNGNEGLIFA